MSAEAGLGDTCLDFHTCDIQQLPRDKDTVTQAVECLEAIVPYFQIKNMLSDLKILLWRTEDCMKNVSPLGNWQYSLRETFYMLVDVSIFNKKCVALSLNP